MKGWDFDNTPVPVGSAEHFRQAKENLDAARSAYAAAESALIHAQRRYNEASREYTSRMFPRKDVR